MAPFEDPNSRPDVANSATKHEAVHVKAGETKVKKEEDNEDSMRHTKRKVQKSVNRRQEQNKTIRRLKQSLLSERQNADELCASSKALRARTNALEKELRDTLMAKKAAEKKYDSYRAWATEETEEVQKILVKMKRLLPSLYRSSEAHIERE